MDVYYTNMAPPNDRRPAVLTIGKFDGVHRGHQKILQAAKALKQNKERLTVISFSPHPLWALKKQVEYREQLTPRLEKERWLAYFGVDSLIETAFTAAYAETTPEVFVNNHLARLNLSHIIIGDEFNFGKGRKSDVDLLKELCEPFAIQVVATPIITVNHNKISSTTIRNLIRKGEIQAAESLLGHSWYVSGKVQNGEMIGLDDYVLPKAGTYQTREGQVKITNAKTIKIDTGDGYHTLHIQ